jgi:hypothetical protein
MESGVNAYIQILFDIIIAAVIATVLFYYGSRIKKEKSLVGFTSSSKEEKYIGYSLLASGAVVIVVSILEIILLLMGGVGSVQLFRLSSINLGGLSISGQILGLFAGTSFWFMVFTLCGNKLLSLGFDMLRGRSIHLKRAVKN